MVEKNTAILEKRKALIQKIFEDEAMLENEEELLYILLRETVTDNVLDDSATPLTRGQIAADKLARFAGSWTFILSFFFILALWICINLFFISRPFDPYPFILLNLILSCLASIQVPIIMMSQNRQEEKDRLRSKNDFKVNLKAEIIIEDIHSKLENILERLDKLDSNTADRNAEPKAESNSL